MDMFISKVFLGGLRLVFSAGFILAFCMGIVPIIAIPVAYSYYTNDLRNVGVEHSHMVVKDTVCVSYWEATTWERWTKRRLWDTAWCADYQPG